MIVRKGLLQLHCALKMVTLASCVVLVDYLLVVQQIQGMLPPSYQKVVLYT